MKTGEGTCALEDGTVYSKRKDYCPLSAPQLEAYIPIVGEESIQRLSRAAKRLRGIRLLEINSSAQGGGVAEMLFSTIPFLNNLGIEAEWKVVRGSREYFEITKTLHNLLQGKEGELTPEMKELYLCTLEECANADLIDYEPDVVTVHDPQPLGLTRFLRRNGANWLWRCHIDCAVETLKANPGLWDFITDWAEHYDAVIFSAAHYVLSRWPLTKFIIPPYIDPLSEKNREMDQKEIDDVLARYQIDPIVPIIAQIGRFDPWKGLGRTIAAYREVRKEAKCQLVLAGGLATDDPEGARILSHILEETKNEDDIHVLHLPMTDRLQNWTEVNALQRAATVIMQPSTREGFGLVVTEALWKGKPVLASDAGGLALQIRDGYNGYFYETPRKTAQRVVHLLNSPRARGRVGQRGREYVREHFLLPDRIADYLTAMDITRALGPERQNWNETIISFHPWFKLEKRRWNRRQAGLKPRSGSNHSTAPDRAKEDPASSGNGDSL